MALALTLAAVLGRLEPLGEFLGERRLAQRNALGGGVLELQAVDLASQARIVLEQLLDEALV